jgi:PTS system galactitol-specific IIA component
MQPCEIFVTSGIHFADAEQALVHIGREMLAQGVVNAGYPGALLAREAQFPTGIALDQHAVAIPHCGAEHARRPCLYLIRPAQPVPFQQADEEGTLAVSLIIALIVTDPQQQLVLLRTLFGQLQDAEFLDALLAAPDEALGELFRQRLFSLPSSPTS